MNKISKCLTGFVCLFCLLVPGVLSDAPWPMFRHDAFHTGRSPYVGS